MDDSDEQWPFKSRARDKQSTKYKYKKRNPIPRVPKASVSSTSSSLSELPETPSVQTQHHASVRNVIKVSAQAPVTIPRSFTPPVNEAPQSSHAQHKQSPIANKMDVIGGLYAAGESDDSTFEPTMVQERLVITLPPKTKVAKPSITSSDSTAPLALGRRRLASEAALSDGRPAKRLKETASSREVEVQTGSCHSRKYKHTKRCTACISKKSGEPCRFRDIRAFIVSHGVPTGHAIFHGIPVVSSHTAPSKPHFNRKWRNNPDRKDIQHVKTSAARIMLPILLEERKALEGRESQVIRRNREVEVRVTCDRCLTSVFSTSFICTDCGREFCLECFASLESMDGTTASSLHPKLVDCGMFKSGVTHPPRVFLPVSRLPITELDETILEMEKLLENLPETLLVPNINTLIFASLDAGAAIIEGTDAKLRELLDEAECRSVADIVVPDSSTTFESLSITSFDAPSALPTAFLDIPTVHSTTPQSPAMISNRRLPTTPSSISTLTPLPESRMSSLPPPDVLGMPKDPTGIKSLAFQTFHHTELSDEMFRLLWAEGHTLVVTDLLTKMRIQWTPEYFISHYGDSVCAITNCDTETVQPSTVTRFFSQFGNYLHRGEAILKLKDWPPTADFKNAFPALFDDFHRAVPAPNYTRRDGFYNFSAHFPTNAVVPDMGPKMYNAFKSRENGYGSTRLHMDMADAVNIMLYSTPLPGEDVGYAVWDIFPSTSSSKIRNFLKEEFPLETSPVQYVDPIHSQYFYLTPTLRTKLHKKYGVRSWRIYQKPGDAVFIPAGCAHQVCNLADCIKVAVDFVSPENLSRCGQLTKEFRSENEKVTWKEDILQLSNMCWSAWENTREMEKSMGSVKSKAS